MDLSTAYYAIQFRWFFGCCQSYLDQCLLQLYQTRVLHSENTIVLQNKNSKNLVDMFLVLKLSFIDILF